MRLANIIKNAIVYSALAVTLFAGCKSDEDKKLELVPKSRVSYHNDFLSKLLLNHTFAEEMQTCWQKYGPDATAHDYSLTEKHTYVLCSKIELAANDIDNYTVDDLLHYVHTTKMLNSEQTYADYFSKTNTVQTKTFDGKTEKAIASSLQVFNAPFDSHGTYYIVFAHKSPSSLGKRLENVMNAVSSVEVERDAFDNSYLYVLDQQSMDKFLSEEFKM